MTLLLFSLAFIAVSDITNFKYSSLSNLHVYWSPGFQECSTSFFFSPTAEFHCNSISGQKLPPYITFDGRHIKFFPDSSGVINMKFCIGEINSTGKYAFAIGDHFDDFGGIMACKSEVDVKYPLVLDRYLLSDISSTHDSEHNIVLDSSQWTSICTSFDSAAHSSGAFVKFTTLDIHIFGMKSPEYWLDYCRSGHGIVKVKHGKLDMNLIANSQSPCAVKLATGIAGKDTHQSTPLLCFEDVLSAVWKLRSNYSNALPVPAIPGETDRSIMYLSTSSMLWSRDESYMTPPTDSPVYSQLAAVVLAFQNCEEFELTGTEMPRLVVESLLGGVWAAQSFSPALPGVDGIIRDWDESAARDIKDGMFHLAYAVDGEDWDMALASVAYQWFDWFGSNDTVYQNRNKYEIVRWLDFFGLHTNVDICASYRQTHPSYRWHFLCHSHVARERLGELLRLTPSAGEQPSAIETHILRLADSISLTQMEGYFNTRASLEPPGPALEPLEISRTHVGVLMFVAPEDAIVAAEAVQGWREECPHCGLATHFVIFPVYVDRSGVEGDDKPLKDTTVYWEPAMRLVLLQTVQWIEQMSVRNDLVAVLVGMEAIWAFRHPGRKYGSGLVPSVVLGAHSETTLPCPVVFALNEEGRRGRDVQDIDIRAFAGRSSNVRAMAREVLGSDGSAYSLLGAADSLREYAYRRRELISADTSKRYFDFAVATRDPIPVSVIPTFEQRDEVAKWPVQRFREEREAVVENIREIFDILGQGRNFDAINLLIHMSHSTNESDNVARVLYELARKLKFHSSGYSVREKLESIDLIVNYVKWLSANDTYSNLRRGLMTLIDSHYYEIGLIENALMWYENIAPSPTHAIVNPNRQLWHHQRRKLSVDPSTGLPKVHIYTVASDFCEELDNLLFSAHLAGVQVNVLGLGRAYTDYTQKIEWYVESIIANESIADDDVILLVDAYDVVLTPAVRRIGKALETSPTPLVGCSEYGVYPEPAAPWFYARGSEGDGDDMFRGETKQGIARYLNSGCLLGRAGQMKEFLADIHKDMRLVRDDQQLFVRYMLRHPHLLSLDLGNHIFQCGYKESHLSLEYIFVNGSVRYNGKYHPVALFHCNNRSSLQLYHALVRIYRMYYDAYISGRFEDILLDALHDLWDGNTLAAKEVVEKHFLDKAHTADLAVYIMDQ